MDPGEAISRATERFLSEAAPLTPTEWTTRPAPGDWSASEIAEHVAIANVGIRSRLDRLTSIVGATPDVIDEEIPFLFYRGDEPPDVAAPSGAWVDRDKALDRLRASAAAVTNREGGRGEDLRDLGARHPVFGLLDGVQWLLFVAAHTERHRAQLIGLRRTLAT